MLMPPVHPRERGEHITAGLPRLPIFGSSPRARGTRPLDDFHSPPFGSSPRARGTRDTVRERNHRTRFIPASAGNTIVTVLSKPSISVHPRERGEHSEQAVVTKAMVRFIPASAGNTGGQHFRCAAHSVHPRERGEHGAIASGFACQTVHPRERGEHMRFVSVIVTFSGSSPRARGTHFRHR